ncbi:hypothetical protein [Sphingomicrobium clamense]|uniref:PS II complex 12 kDa extrinsic protein n=1 Tax=Sphingomicrobium clamense TaxID=2851013 RepID=A0ABS6V7R0_9SPHN|nr:hypothetical protein [Sphingomicrobium sp. B8]MBW0145600.1 hypothetical protein [Sphingomicrobium sp. B8]
MRFLMTSALVGALSLAACSEQVEAPVDEDVSGTKPADVIVESDAVIDVNVADADQLAAVADLTEEQAAALVAARPYADAVAYNTALVAAVGEEKAAMVREKMFVPINLNTASEEAIRLIPGMTDKMVHEFEEYRPYEDMAEFDREIGKYVDEAEVARLRQYVTL